MNSSLQGRLKGFKCGAEIGSATTDVLYRSSEEVCTDNRRSPSK